MALRSIRGMSILICGLLACSMLAVAAFGIWREHRRLQSSIDAGDSVKALSLLHKGLIALSAERSVSEIGLNMAGQLPPALRQTINEARQRAREHFRLLDALLDERSFASGEAEFVTSYRGLLGRIEEDRQRIDRDLARPRSERSPVATQLGPQLGDTILALFMLAEKLRVDQRTLTPAIIVHDLTMQRAFLMHEFGGRERTHLAIAVLSRGLIDREGLAEMQQWHGMVMQGWMLTSATLERPFIEAAVKEAADQLADGYFKRYQAVRDRIYANADTGQYNVTFDAFFAASSAALDLSARLLSAAGETNIRLAEAMQGEAGRNLAAIIAIALAGLLLLGFLIYFFLVRVSLRVSHVAIGIEKVAAGDDAVDIGRFGGHDEIGRLVRALEVFRENAAVRRRLEVDAMAERDRERHRQARLEDLIREFRERIAGVVSTLDTNIAQMRGTSAALTEVADTASREAASARASSSDATRNVAAVADSADQLSAAIREIADQTQKAAEVVAGASSMAKRTDADVAALASAAERIGAVVATIRTIAEQTNLLALNATIEAARAGEAGKGFAVVANEVKQLAGLTARATDEIAGQIQSVQSAAGGAVQSIRAIIGQIDAINQITAAVAAAVEEQDASTQSISGSIVAASRESEQAMRASETVAMTIDATSREAQSVQATSHGLARIAAQLSGAVDAFLEAVTGDVNERRQSLRQRMNEAVVVCARGRRYPATILDISEGGARISGLDGFAIGDRLIVEWPRGRSIDGRVVWREADRLGITFAEPIVIEPGQRLAA